jgi:hypothetical protein
MFGAVMVVKVEVKVEVEVEVEEVRESGDLGLIYDAQIH